MKSNISKNFADKSKCGLRFADGLVPQLQQQQEVLNPQITSALNSALAPKPQGQTLSQGEQASIALQSDLNNLGKVNATPGLGEGAQRNFFNKSLSDLQGGNNQPFLPSAAPNTTAAFGPNGPMKLPSYAPGRTPLRQYQEPQFADGMVPETAEQLSARIAAKYGTSGNTPAPQPAPQPVQQAPAPQPKPQGGLLGGALGLIRDRAAQTKAAAGYKNGMTPHVGPGIVHGPGGPREDKVDAKLSDGEAVLPAATVEYLGGPEEVAHLIEQTNGKAPARGLRDGIHAVNGVSPEEVAAQNARQAAQEAETSRINARAETAARNFTTPEQTAEVAARQAGVAQQQAAIDSRLVAQRQAGVSGQQAAIDGSVGAEQARQVEKATMHERLNDPRIKSQPLMKPGQVPIEYTATQVPAAAPKAPVGLQLAEGSSIDYTPTSAKAPPTGNSIARAEELRAKLGIEPGQTKPSLKLVDPVPVAQPAPAASAAPATPAELSRGEQIGRKAAKLYQDTGKARGLAGKALNAVVPAVAAIDTMGEDGIRVEGNREGDPTNETASGIERVGNAAKEVGLRAGDWGTKGLDLLMDIPLWAANKMGATADGKPLEYGLVNKNYRQGMRDANMDGVTIPPSASEREMSDAKAVADGQAESKAMHKKYANKDGNMGTVVDQAAIDALKAANAAKAKTVEVAAATKAGNIPGQNHIPEAVTMQDQAASGMMGKEVDKLTGVSSTGNGGLRGMAQRLNSYATNEGARQGRNAELQLRGDGARYEKGADGKVTLTNSGDFDGSTKMQYTGADGKPTAVFAGSMENQRGINDARGMRKQLANIEQMNLERNAKEDITDVGLRTYSRAKLGQLDAQAAKYNEALLSKQPSQLDIEKFNLDKQKFAHELQKTENLQGNNIRDYKAERSDKVNKRVDSMLDTMAPTAGLKDDALTAAQARRADLQEALYSTFGKNMPEDDAKLNEAMPQLMAQAKTSLAIRDAIKNRGLWNKISNIGRDPWTTLHAAKLSPDGTSVRFENGFSISIDDIVKDGNAKSADIYAALQSRTK